MSDPAQDALIAARRDHILDAAARVFAEKGFHPTTIKDVAKAARVADGTIYNYFDNKAALLIGIVDRLRARAIAEFDPTALAADDMRAFLIAYIRQPLNALRGENFELFRVVMSEVLVNADLRERCYASLLRPTIDAAAPMMQRWIDAGRLAPFDVALTLRAITGMILGVLLETLMDDPLLNARWEALPALLTDLILDGLEKDTP